MEKHAAGISGRTEAALKSISVKAARLTKASKAPTGKGLSKAEGGAQFSGVDRAAFLVLMIWNQTAQPSDRQSLFECIMIDHIAKQDWFAQARYMDSADYRHRVNAMVQVAMDRLVETKKLTKVRLAKEMGISTTALNKAAPASWWDRFDHVCRYLDHLLSEAAQSVHSNMGR